MFPHFFWASKKGDFKDALDLLKSKMLLNFKTPMNIEVFLKIRNFLNESYVKLQK